MLDPAIIYLVNREPWLGPTVDNLLPHLITNCTVIFILGQSFFFYTLACSLSSCNAKEWCPALLQYLCLVSLLVASFLHVGFGGALPTPRIALFVRPSVSNEIPGRGSGVGGLGSGQTA